MRALQNGDTYLVATNRGIMRIDRLGGSVDKRLISVGDNKMEAFHDNGNGYLVSVQDGLNFSLKIPSSIYRVSYGLDTVERIAAPPVFYRPASLIYSHFDSVFVSTTNGGAFVSVDFMESWTPVQAREGACSMDEQSYEYIEHGDSLYLANRYGLFRYRPFDSRTDIQFCNGPNRTSGLIKKYRDSMIVSDSGYVYRISKLGENIWSEFPLPSEYSSVYHCSFDIFSTYLVFQSQAMGCGVGDSIKISVYDLKNRKMVKTFTNSEWKYQISYTTTQDRLFVNLGKGGIAVYDETMTESIYKSPECVPARVLHSRPNKRIAKEPKKISVDGRLRDSKPRPKNPIPSGAME